MNAAILRQRYLKHAAVDRCSITVVRQATFLVIDMKDGCWHVGLGKNFPYLTTFHT